MKPLLQFAASMVALGSLLGGAASAATAVADLPLKISVVTKPNVVFGMDDSGSMDWEILLDTNSGILYWNGFTAWDGGRGKPLIDDNVYIPYVYLFPQGTATGAQIYPFNSVYGQAVPPTNQFAWLRSAKFNPLYYDSAVTYPHWSDAYVSGALRSYPDSPPASAKLHPAVATSPTMNVGNQWDTGDGNFTSSGYMFYVQRNMVLPIGTRVGTSSAGAGGAPCRGGTQTLTSAQTVGNGDACWAAIPYYPATFWHPEACIIGANCVAAPDGSGTLKRYEIKSTTASYPSGRAFAAELQNFANWFTFYRKRKLMLAGSMGRVLDSISGLRLGVVPFNDNPSPLQMFDADGTTVSANRRAAIGPFYLNAMSAQGTPTHDTVKNIAQHFATNTSVIQNACQRNNMFIVTDGFSNTTTTSVPAYNAATYGAGAPYTVTRAGSLADLALAYYTNRLRATGGSSLPAGRVPPSTATTPGADKNPNLHINTYAVTLGVRGSIWPFPYPLDPAVAGTRDPYVTAPTWPTPVADDPSMIDDQYHATVNGRGQMYLASNPDETAARITAGLNDILKQKSAQGGVALSSVNLGKGDQRAYAASYDPSGWSGDVSALTINPDTGAVGAVSSWPGNATAASLLDARAWATRVIATRMGGSAMALVSAGAAANPGNVYGATPALMNYLVGDRSNEGTVYRSRASLLGAIINAEPVVDRETGVVYVASGEGMLHAFDTVGADGGKELWAYVPQPALANLGATAMPGYDFHTKLDGSPALGQSSATNRVLVAGMGAAGRGYYGIDVTSPRAMTTGSFATKSWEFPADSDSTTTKAKVGLTVGKPIIVRTGWTPSRYVALVTSGYNNTFDGKGRLWVLDAQTGAVLKEFVAPAGTLTSEAGVAQISAFGESDGTVRYVYGGDLLGNVWRIDLDQPSLGASAFTKIAQLRGPAGDVQPVTTAPELTSYSGLRIVYVGTGRLLDYTDFGDSKVQSMYAISDGALLTNARSSLVRQTYVSGSDTVATTPVDWSTQRGWYMDLPAGEQANTRPSVGLGALAFVTNTAGWSDCSASSRLYVLDVLTGGRFPRASFTTRLISDVANAGPVTLAVSRGGSKLLGITREFGTGNTGVEELGAISGVNAGKNAWREIRR